MATSEKAKKKLARASIRPEPEQPESLSDDSLEQAIVDCITRRLRSTVRIRPLPNRCRLADLHSLCPSAVAIRLPWNLARCRHKGVAFLEFASPEAAAKHAAALQGSRALGGRELTTSVPPVQPGDVCASKYNTRRVVVSSIEGRVSANQLLALAPGAQRIRFPEAGTKAGKGRHAPSVAIVTFGEPGQALAAVRNCQGAEIGGGKTSWMLEKIPGKAKPQHLIDRRTLVLTGVQRAVTDARLLLALPRCAKLERRPSGVAVAHYDSEAACAADLAAWPSDDADMPKATFGHRKAASGAELAPQPRNRLILAGLPTGTKKSALIGFLGSDSVAAAGLQRVTLASNGRLAVLNFESEQAALTVRDRLRTVASASPFGKDVKLKVAFSLDQLLGSRRRIANKVSKKKASK